RARRGKGGGAGGVGDGGGGALGGPGGAQGGGGAPGGEPAGDRRGGGSGRPRIRAGETAQHDGGCGHRSPRPPMARPRKGTRPKPTSQAPLAVRHGTQGGRQRPLATSSPPPKADSVPTTTKLTPTRAPHRCR